LGFHGWDVAKCPDRWAPMHPRSGIERFQGNRNRNRSYIIVYIEELYADIGVWNYISGISRF
jgi:hypothetical protein